MRWWLQSADVTRPFGSPRMLARMRCIELEQHSEVTHVFSVLPAAANLTVDELHKDLYVIARHGSDRHGAIRSVVRDKYFIVEWGALAVVFSSTSVRSSGLLTPTSMPMS